MPFSIGLNQLAIATPKIAVFIIAPIDRIPQLAQALQKRFN